VLSTRCACDTPQYGPVRPAPFAVYKYGFVGTASHYTGSQISAKVGGVSLVRALAYSARSVTTRSSVRAVIWFQIDDCLTPSLQVSEAVGGLCPVHMRIDLVEISFQNSKHRLKAKRARRQRRQNAS
jgi:hypothetical protein